LKKIFDVNALDLAKVGKAFGFAVPPRVNVNIGGGKAVAGKKRRRGVNEDESGESEEIIEDEDNGDDEVRMSSRTDKGKARRTETLGQKRVDKEKFRKGAERKQRAGTGQWSR
jgi:ATP-dependent RNA helicase DDX18/HAS1